MLGFEPRIVDPKSTALPLGHTRMVNTLRLVYEKRYYLFSEVHFSVRNQYTNDTRSLSIQTITHYHPPV